MNFWTALDSVLDDLAVERSFGYPGFQSSEFFQLESAELLLNERLCVYAAHVHSYLGHRSLCFFKNAGFYSAYLQMLNASVLGANAAMVAIVTDDVEGEGSETICASEDLIETLDCISYSPRNPRKFLDLLPEAISESENYQLPVVIRLENQFFDQLGDSVERPDDVAEPSPERASERWVLHPKTATEFAQQHANRLAEYDGIQPPSYPEPGEAYFDSNPAYRGVYETISATEPDLVTAGFGGYTLAEGSCVEYALSYNGGVASAVGAQIAGTDTIAVIGDGGLTHEPTALYEAVKRNIPLTVVVLDNGGISGTYSTGLDIKEIIPPIFEYFEVGPDIDRATLDRDDPVVWHVQC